MLYFNLKVKQKHSFALCFCFLVFTINIYIIYFAQRLPRPHSGCKYKRQNAERSTLLANMKTVPDYAFTLCSLIEKRFCDQKKIC